jgi:iron complex outermembrane receptor protein
MLRRTFLLLLVPVCLAPAQPRPGVLRGKAAFKGSGVPVHNAYVSLTPSGRSTQTAADGSFEFRDVAPGAYTVLAHMHSLTAEKKTVAVEAGATASVDFELDFSPLRESVTVTATGQEVTVQEAFQTVTTRESHELAAVSSSTSLGDLLERESGIAKRGYGPGASRPVVRGFDGDRVLVLQDGVRTGTLSSSSGDHGEPVDAASLDRVEVVRGPATLLYGSNAIGGVVNMLTNHHLQGQHPHEGLHATLSGTGGTANGQGGGAGSFEYGKGDWLLFGGGGGMRMGDYSTPLGKVENSFSQMKHASAGIARFGRKGTFTVNYGLQEGHYGTPPVETGEEHAEAAHHDEDVSIEWRRQNLRFNGLVRELGPAFEQMNIGLNYSDWNHKELEGAEVGTRFFNKQFIYRVTLTQRKRGRLTGNLGFWGMARDFEAQGGEALAPPVRQNAFAVFGLEEVTFERVRFQFGGRLETNRYSPSGLQARRFTGASLAAGVFIPTWHGGAVVANYMDSYRAPALEELYNHGPHPGNAAYEIGNANLVRERSRGVDLSLRHQSRRARFEANYFHYRMNSYVYFRPTGAKMDGLPVAEYAQAGARYQGMEARAELALRESLWVLAGVDAVDAQLLAGRTPLPRIPPVRGRIGLDFRRQGFSVRPELVLAGRQSRIAPNETETAGYSVINLTAGYLFARQHTLHSFHVNLFNAANRLYRNHLSFIKDYAPEIGRGIRVGYTFSWL